MHWEPASTKRDELIIIFQASMESLVYCVLQLIKQHSSLPNLIYPNKYSMLLSANTLHLSCIELGSAAFMYIYGMIINVQLLTFFFEGTAGEAPT